MNVTFPHLLQIVNTYDYIFAEMETQKTSYPKDKIRILFSKNISDAAVKNFRGHEYSNVEKITKALTEDDLIKEIKDVHILAFVQKHK
jgi:D-3-phosphoglycerate dehydrogenase